jgi:hypothetical protein
VVCWLPLPSRLYVLAATGFFCRTLLEALEDLLGGGTGGTDLAVILCVACGLEGTQDSADVDNNPIFW